MVTNDKLLSDQEKIKAEILKWIDNHRETLPLNIDFWDIYVSKISDQHEGEKLTFGKYNAEDIATNAFYKPHSRIVKIL